MDFVLSVITGLRTFNIVIWVIYLQTLDLEFHNSQTFLTVDYLDSEYRKTDILWEKRKPGLVPCLTSHPQPRAIHFLCSWQQTFAECWRHGFSVYFPGLLLSAGSWIPRDLVRPTSFGNDTFLLPLWPKAGSLWPHHLQHILGFLPALTWVCVFSPWCNSVDRCDSQSHPLTLSLLPFTRLHGVWPKRRAWNLKMTSLGMGRRGVTEKKRPRLQKGTYGICPWDYLCAHGRSRGPGYSPGQ